MSYELDQLLAFVRQGNLQGLTIFGDGASRDLNVLVSQQVSDFAVAQRLAWIFLRDELFDQCGIAVEDTSPPA